MSVKLKPDWERMAQKHDEYRIFLAFAQYYEGAFYQFIHDEMAKVKKEARR